MAFFTMVPTAEMTVVLEPLALVVTVTTAGSVAVVVRMVGCAIVVTGMAESHLLFLFWASRVTQERSLDENQPEPDPKGRPEAEDRRNPKGSQQSRAYPRTQDLLCPHLAEHRKAESGHRPPPPKPRSPPACCPEAASTCSGCAGRGSGGGRGVGRRAFLGARYKLNLQGERTVRMCRAVPPVCSQGTGVWHLHKRGPENHHGWEHLGEEVPETA